MENKQKTILIVEDDPGNLKLFRDILQYKEYTTLEATNGQQGVELAKIHKPDLVLMDMDLPVMDGIEATKMIKADENLKKTVVIALTANAMPGDRERMMTAGCHDYISKPFRISEFLTNVARYLDQRE